eukprot:5283608-Prorocentrum_lima.AAC.1
MVESLSVGTTRPLHAIHHHLRGILKALRWHLWQAHDKCWDESFGTCNTCGARFARRSKGEI